MPSREAKKTRTGVTAVPSGDVTDDEGSWFHALFFTLLRKNHRKSASIDKEHLLFLAVDQSLLAAGEVLLSKELGAEDCHFNHNTKNSKISTTSTFKTHQTLSFQRGYLECALEVREGSTPKPSQM